MRISALVLVVSSAAAALCQSPAPVNPQQHWLTPPPIAQPSRDFTSLPPQWPITNSLPSNTLLVPRASPLQPGFDAPIDPKIVVHPPQMSLGEQPKGTLLAQNLYPGLQLLPIEESKLKALPIPTAWPKCEIKPVESGAAGK